MSSLLNLDPATVWMILQILLLSVLLVAFMFLVYSQCCRLKQLSDRDVQAFHTFKEVYKGLDIEVDQDLFDVERTPECLCLETIRASKPADAWSTARRHLGNNFDSVVQLAERIDEALLEYQHRVANNEGMNSAGVPTLVVRKFGAKYPHYPSFIVAQEWRDWANRTTQNSQNVEVHNEVLQEVRKRLEWLESVELGLVDPGITDLHDTYGWDTKRLSLLQVFTRDVRPRLIEMRDSMDRSILEQSHAEVLKACFNLTKRLILESMRFFECVSNTESLRVKSEVVDHEHSLPASLWHLSVQYLSESLQEPQAVQPVTRGNREAYDRFQRMSHMDKCLTAWYAYMRPQLLERVNPENTSKDVWESLLEANRHYQNLFEGLQHGFDFAEYQQKGGWIEEREALRQRHYEGLKRSLSSFTLCLDNEQFERLLDVMSFFLSRTLFATNQMANICLLQSSLSLLTGRLYITRLLSQNHILCSIMFMDSVADQLRYQINEIKEILLAGWQKARRQTRTSHWANTRPLDNFRLAMQAKRNVDKSLNDLEFILTKLRQRVTSVSMRSEQDLKEEKDKHMLLYTLTWRNVAAWQHGPFTPEIRERIAPSWGEELQVTDKLKVENMRNYARYSVCERQWTAFHSSASLDKHRMTEDLGDDDEDITCPLLCPSKPEPEQKSRNGASPT